MTSHLLHLSAQVTNLSSIFADLKHLFVIAKALVQNLKFLLARGRLLY